MAEFTHEIWLFETTLTLFCIQGLKQLRVSCFAIAKFLLLAEVLVFPG